MDNTGVIGHSGPGATRILIGNGKFSQFRIVSCDRSDLADSFAFDDLNLGAHQFDGIRIDSVFLQTDVQLVGKASANSGDIIGKAPIVFIIADRADFDPIRSFLGEIVLNKRLESGTAALINRTGLNI